MKLNNKGFAITGILYGLLILFALLVGSYLTILTAKKNRLDSIVTSIEEEYNKTEDDKEEYTITYDANGGSGAPEPQTEIKGNALTLSSVVPTKTDYTFLCWNTNQDGSGTSYQPGGSYTANESITLYATWSSNSSTYNVTLYVDGQNNGNKTVDSGGKYEETFTSMTDDVSVSCTNGQTADVWVNTSYIGTITINKVTANTTCYVTW